MYHRSILLQESIKPFPVALAMVSSVSDLGFLIGPPLIGYIAELFSLRYSFGIFALFGLLMFVLTTNMRVFKESK